eukprot:3411058-Rhodomonas_salina.2
MEEEGGAPQCGCLWAALTCVSPPAVAVSLRVQGHPALLRERGRAWSRGDQEGHVAMKKRSRGDEWVVTWWSHGSEGRSRGPTKSVVAAYSRLIPDIA